MDDASQVEPVPRRFWWLKRLGIAGGCLLLAMLLLVIVWNLEADRRLNAEIERARADGGPVLVADFDAELDAVPDADNAALLYEEAIEKLVFTSAAGVYYRQFVDEREPLSNHPADVDELLALNAEPLRLVREARFCPSVAWSHRLEDAVTSGIVLGSASDQRNLAKLLYFVACVHHERGNDAKALEIASDFDALNRAIDGDLLMVSKLVAWSTHDLNFRLIEQFGGRLQIAEQVVDPSERTSAPTRSQVASMIKSLLDETHDHAAVIRAFRSERAFEIGVLDGGTGTTGLAAWQRLISYFTRPITVLDQVRLVKLSSLGADAAREADWPEADAHLPRDEGPLSLFRRLTRPMTDASFFYFGSQGTATRRFVKRHYHYLARRRMAATALAIRLFEVDHQRRPDTLAELVPEYLPHVPVDSFSPDGAAIRYRPRNGAALLYSVGVDGIDHQGMIKQGIDGRLLREQSDIPFYLDGRPKRGSTTAPTSQKAVDENADEEDE
jgi:hypothetical protein